MRRLLANGFDGCDPLLEQLQPAIKTMEENSINNLSNVIVVKENRTLIEQTITIFTKFVQSVLEKMFVPCRNNILMTQDAKRSKSVLLVRFVFSQCTISCTVENAKSWNNF